jgi:hypothetical protein
MQEFATAIEQLAHRTYRSLPEEHNQTTGRQSIRFDIKFHLLLGREKTVNEALRQAIEL